MKTKIAIVALAAAAFTACNKNETPAEVSPYITINTSVGELTTKAITRATATAFETGDQISVYAYESGDVSKQVVTNSINTFSGSAWTASPMMRWKDLSSSHDFVAIYPTHAITSFTAESYTLTDVMTTNDILVATTISRTASQGIVPLTFDHVMAKVVVNLTFRNEFDGTPTVSSVSTSAQKEATVNFVTKIATATGSAATATFTGTTANTTYAAILAPQSIRTIDIVINGKTYTYTHGQDFVLGGGMVQTISLIVGRNKIELGSVTINDWGTGSEITGGEAID